MADIGRNPGSVNPESVNPGSVSEEFWFELSAFLSAARSITFVLQSESKEAYDAWFPNWCDGLKTEERALLKSMNKTA